MSDDGSWILNWFVEDVPGELISLLCLLWDGRLLTLGSGESPSTATFMLDSNSLPSIKSWEGWCCQACTCNQSARTHFCFSKRRSICWLHYCQMVLVMLWLTDNISDQISLRCMLVRLEVSPVITAR